MGDATTGAKAGGGRFLAVFLGLLAVLFVAELTAPVQRHLVVPWTQAVASASGWFAAAIDPGTIVNGATLLDPASGFGVTIVAGCNGVEATLMLVAAMLAWPGSFRHKALGIVAGVAAIQGLNLVRVVSLYFLGRWNLAVFEFAHLYAWQLLIMLDALVVWLVWLRTAPAPREAAHA